MFKPFTITKIKKDHLNMLVEVLKDYMLHISVYSMQGQLDQMIKEELIIKIINKLHVKINDPYTTNFKLKMDLSTAILYYQSLQYYLSIHDNQFINQHINSAYMYMAKIHEHLPQAYHLKQSSINY